MASRTQEELITFEQLRERVGLSESRLRAVLLALGISPVALEEDARMKRYRASWEADIRAFIASRQDRN